MPQKSANAKPGFRSGNDDCGKNCPAGPQYAPGMISAARLKQRSDPVWTMDRGMAERRAVMAKYRPGAVLTHGSYVAARGPSKTVLQVSQQCRGNFSSAHVVQQAAKLHDLSNPTLPPGLTISTSPTNDHPIQGMQIVSPNAESRKLFACVSDR